MNPSRRIVRTDAAPKPGGAYSQAVIGGSLVFVSGQGSTDSKTGKKPEGMEAQTRQALTNVKTVLEAAGTSLENVLKVSVFIDNMDEFAKMNGVYLTFFSKDPPARTTIETRMPGGTRVEVDVVAMLP